MSGHPAWPDNPFWDYSLALYGRPGVEAGCLDLQRRHGQDVNLLLLCCFAAARGIALDAAAFSGIGARVADWQGEVVRPLRALRRRLKARLGHPEPGGVPADWRDLVGALRARILGLELDAERLEQLQLWRLVRELPSGAPAGAALALDNLRLCGDFGPADREALRAILHGAFPETDAGTLEAALAGLGEPPARPA